MAEKTQNRPKDGHDNGRSGTVLVGKNRHPNRGNQHGCAVGRGQVPRVCFDGRRGLLASFAVVLFHVEGSVLKLSRDGATGSIALNVPGVIGEDGNAERQSQKINHDAKNHDRHACIDGGEVQFLENHDVMIEAMSNSMAMVFVWILRFVPSLFGWGGVSRVGCKWGVV